MNAAAVRSLCLSELVEATGTPASTIHHYRRLGLIPAPTRLSTNRFAYEQRHLDALRLVRSLREREGLSLDRIAQLLPGMLADPDAHLASETSEAYETALDAVRVRRRLLDAAVGLFTERSYSEVTVSELAEQAGVAKGSFYRYFSSKEALFATTVEHVVDDTSQRFAAAVHELGGPRGLDHDPEKTAVVFARIIAGAMPILLELGARAAKGDDETGDMARRTLRTLADAVGRPLDPDGPTPAGLSVIRNAFGQVLDWAVAPDWHLP